MSTCNAENLQEILNTIERLTIIRLSVCMASEFWLVFKACQIYPLVLRWSLNGSTALEKQTANCNSPHNRLMSLAMDFCDMWSWKWHQWMPLKLAVFTVYIAFACHFAALHHPTLHPYRSACGISSVSETLTKAKWWEILLAIHSTVGM